jgi:23S rRNA (uracil1939-C5)-methyltransferase
MARKRRRYLPPFEVEIERLGKGGTGVGTAPDGAPVQVRPAPPGARVRVMPSARKKGTWIARRLALIRPAVAHATPPCDAFGLCGGCALQELSLAAQRDAKQAQALSEIAEGLGIDVETLRSRARVHPVRGADAAYGYRNKVELSFGPRRYVSEQDHQDGHPIDGRWLGFHAKGRFDRVADVHRCWLISEGLDALVQTTRRVVLTEDDHGLWDARAHTGDWRHLVLREGFATGELLVAVVTTSEVDAAAVERLADALHATPLPGGRTLVGVVWLVNDGVADVARGETRRVWGRAWLEERLGPVSFRLGIETFFQTSTAGAEILYDTVGEALGDARRGTLLDLYCGIGSIGLYLADRAVRVVGVEEVEQSVAHAREHAAQAGVPAEYRCARMEDALDVLDGALEDPVVVVDPPRVGLHPKVARRLAQVAGDTLVYVACKPASLGRDAAVLADGGWRLDALWTVDLFPQTGHVEVVARFVR